MHPTQSQSTALHQLHVGCGSNYRSGWVNVDVNPAHDPDIQASAEDLSMLENNSCSVIESSQLLQLLNPVEARAVLREWRRLLAPGGELALELPNLARCLESIGSNEGEWDAGLVALFGHPNNVDGSGQTTPARWAWTPESLMCELSTVGFEEIQLVPAASGHATQARLDMRLVARAPSAEESSAVDGETDSNLINLLAWPNYRQPAELDHFFNVFARVLVDQEQVCLHLRVDPQLDPGREEVIAALGESHARVLGGDAALNVALLEGQLSSEEWREAGQCIKARIQTESDDSCRSAAQQMRTEVIVDAAGLLALIQRAETSSAVHSMLAKQQAPHSADAVVPQATYADRIDALHPWCYPLTIHDITVEPGVGTSEDASNMAYRVGCRSTLLLQEIFSRVDFRGKSLLDLGSNCGFWSSFYAMAGANQVLGIESELRHVAQAELYWGTNRFLPIESYEFLEGDLSEATIWQTIRQRGEVDIAICTGALHRINNHEEVLGWMAQVTREAMILDTRIQAGPGQAHNSLTPGREQLFQTLRTLGFEAEVLPVGFANQVGTDAADSYASGTRLVILARRA